MGHGDDAKGDLAERLRFESLVIDLAAGFVNLEPERVDQAIESCLRHIVEALHVRSREYQRLLAIMETAAERPALRFNLVGETRGLAWVEELRLGSTGPTGETE